MMPTPTLIMPIIQPSAMRLEPRQQRWWQNHTLHMFVATVVFKAGLGIAVCLAVMLVTMDREPHRTMCVETVQVDGSKYMTCS